MIAPSEPKTPVVFLSHGAPTLADDDAWTRELAYLAMDMPRPEAVLVVSAQWEEAPLTIGATQTVPLFYDFWGFARKYYAVQYPAPGAPKVAARVRQLLGEDLVHDDPSRGLDHGAYVPLVEMYPEADIPVLQISMPTLDPTRLIEVGRRLAPLRDEGVLIIGSGFSTHNLRHMDPTNSRVPAWSSEFDHWLSERLEATDVDSLLDFQNKAPASSLAHPTTEHFAPLFVALGASVDQLQESETVIAGFWYGLSKRSVRFS